MICREMIPTPEDWIALQGGRPRIFENSSGLYLLLHYYDTVTEHPFVRSKPHFGSVIPTLGENMHASLRSPVTLDFTNRILSSPQTRTVKVPSILLAELHGLACEGVTAKTGFVRSGYERVTNQQQLAEFLESQAADGLTEQRLSIDPNTEGYRLLPLVRVAPQA